MGGAIQTTQEELDQFFAYALPGFLEYVKQHSDRLSTVEKVNSLAGIYSLTAMYMNGGVEKTVLVPLSLLTVDAEHAVQLATDAATLANMATAACESATSDADAAAKRVTDAITDISAEKQAAMNAAAGANAAKSACESATLECQSVISACSAATVNANNQADYAREQGDYAKAMGRNADNSAIAANTQAARAAAAAESAREEVQSLGTLKENCLDATGAATAAVQNAGEKMTEINALIRTISGESSAAPVKMAVSMLETVSSKNKVRQRIGVQLYPTYVMQNVLFQKVSGTSAMVDPSGGIVVNGTGESVFWIIPTQNTELWQQAKVTVRDPRIRLSRSGKIRLNGGRMRIV